MKTAVFEFGKQSLAEWIESNRDCEKMVLVGEVYCSLWDDKYKRPVKGKSGVYEFQTEINIGWHSYDLLFGFDRIAMDFHPKEFDITDLHLLDYEGEINDEDIPYDADENQPSLVLKMLVNRKYGTRFVNNGDFVTTPDKKVLIHCNSFNDVINVPVGTETIGRLAFAAIEEPEFQVILPEGILSIDESAFSNSDGLVKINFPDSLQSLGECAFYGTGLTEVILSDGIEVIPACCFCFVYIKELHLPSNLKTIESSAFVGLECDEVVLPPNVEVVGPEALDGYYQIISVPKSIKDLAHDFYYEEGIDDYYEEHKPMIIWY